MARVSSLISFCLTLLIFFHGYIAQQFPNECQLDQLNVLEPSHVLKFEGGRIEVWDHHAPQLRCSGVSFVRYIIESKGLYLPTFFNTAKLSFVDKGQGLVGKVIPGCAETFQDSPVIQPGRGRGSRSREGQGQGEGQSQGESQRFRDMHQKVVHIRSGDTIATEPGVAQWFYNDGNQPLVIVSVFDLASHHNQLDRNPRAFNLAGNNQQGEEWLQGRKEQPQKNILNGFTAEIIAKALKISLKTAEQLRNPQDSRGKIVLVRGPFSVIRPPLRGERSQEEEEEREGGGGSNGLEETTCSARFTDNLDDPSRADVYKPQLGYITTQNSYDLPLLGFLRLSALRGSIRRNAMVLPQWNANANAVLYVTDGEAHLQIVNDNGDTVFKGTISQGQLIALPQGFPVVKLATSERFRWIEFKTNANAQINTIAGRTSVLRGLPLEVITNAFQISLEEARKVKFNTLETTLTHFSSPTSSESSSVADA